MQRDVRDGHGAGSNPLSDLVPGTRGDHTLYAHLSPFPSQMTGRAMCTMGLKIRQSFCMYVVLLLWCRLHGTRGLRVRILGIFQYENAQLHTCTVYFVHNGSMCMMGLITSTVHLASAEVWPEFFASAAPVPYIAGNVRLSGFQRCIVRQQLRSSRPHFATSHSSTVAVICP